MTQDHQNQPFRHNRKREQNSMWEYKPSSSSDKIWQTNLASNMEVWGFKALAALGRTKSKSLLCYCPPSYNNKNLFPCLKITLLFSISPKQKILLQDHFSHQNQLKISPFPSLHMRNSFWLMRKFSWRLRSMPNLNFDPTVSCRKPHHSLSQSTWRCALLFKDSFHLKLVQVSSIWKNKKYYF